MVTGILYDWSKLNERGLRAVSSRISHFSLHCYQCGTKFTKHRWDMGSIRKNGSLPGAAFCGYACAGRWRCSNGISGRAKREIHRFCANCYSKFSRPKTAQLTGAAGRGVSDTAFCTSSCKTRHWYTKMTSEGRAKVAAAMLKSAGKARSTHFPGIHFRSTWEVKMAEWLKDRGMDFVYEPTTFHTPTGPYTPDFYVPAADLFIEVKGRETSNQKEKREWVASKFKFYETWVCDSGEWETELTPMLTPVR